MNSQWQAYLEQQGATFDNQTGTRFGEPNTELSAIDSGVVIADLSHLGVIGVTGSDAETFLQGQFANDVTRVTEQHSQLNAYCSPKGRILAEFRLLKQAQGYLLVLPRSTVESVIKRLSMFVLRAAVTLADESDRLHNIGLAGQGATALLRNQLGAAPGDPDEVLQHGELTVIRIPGDPERYQILGPIESQMAIWNALREHGTCVGTAAWRALDIRAGLPEIPAALQDVWVPQMLNLHALGGISFKKGCYPGQEIVARTQYLGTLKRRMFRARSHGDTIPKPGDEIFGGDDTGQSTGRVVSAAGSADLGYDLLAVLQIGDVEAKELHLGAPDGPPLQLLDLPYSLDTD